MPDFATDLLKTLGAPTTPHNLRFVNAWAKAEGTKAAYNPLATTRPAPGASAFNSVGVRNFRDYQQGLNATRDTLLNGHYNTIVSLMKSGQATPTQMAQAVAQSPWGTGSGVLRVLGAAPTTGDLVYRPGVPTTKVPSAGATPKPKPPPKFNAPTSSLIQLLSAGGDPRDTLGSFVSTLAQANADYARQMKTYRQQALKNAPTQLVQEAGVVSPGGDLQDPSTVNANPILKAASTQIGKPYVFGSGPDTTSFDCSDLIQWSYKQAGIQLPRDTFHQIKVGKDVTGQALRPGDLIFPSKHHVVMYVGDGKVIAAPHTGTVVQYQPVSKFANPVAVRRVF